MNIGKLRSVANECVTGVTFFTGVTCVTRVKEKPKRQLSVQAHRASRQPQLQTKSSKMDFKLKVFFCSNFIEAKKSQRLEPQNQKIATIVRKLKEKETFSKTAKFEKVQPPKKVLDLKMCRLDESEKVRY